MSELAVEPAAEAVSSAPVAAALEPEPGQREAAALLLVTGRAGRANRTREAQTESLRIINTLSPPSLALRFAGGGVIVT